ncbi:hypothetical protein J4417_00175 [Candidatus Woesearchaeota archaeon]|nr:hypothetical protein [Candidatus Woesearchaeota archaeon]
MISTKIRNALLVGGMYCLMGSGLAKADQNASLPSLEKIMCILKVDKPSQVVQLPGGYVTTPRAAVELDILANVISGSIQITPKVVKDKYGVLREIKVFNGTYQPGNYLEEKKTLFPKADIDRNHILTEEEVLRLEKEMYSSRKVPSQ